MLDSNLQELRVMDYSTALQTVQSLESRGDFQFKGIHKMFLQVADWTEKYLANRILPNLDQIIREVSLEKEKGELFMKELCFRYNPPIFKKIVSVEFDPAGIGPQEDINTFLRRSTVFARPSNLDSGSAHRYVNGVNEASLASIKRWLGAHRVLKPKEVFIEFIISKIRDNKLNETYASYEIGKLFSCQYDTTKELREVTVNINLKPILKKLVSEKLLYFFRNDSASKSGNKSVFLFNNKDEIMIRVEAYLEYMKTVIVPELQKIGVIGDVGEEDYENFPELAKTIRKCRETR
ncbi:MAG: hypothetical protein K8R21_06950 [Leptospira sp.]|nr:hypothetical protein [Leptospira sp.]